MEVLLHKLIPKTSSDKNISWGHSRKQLQVPHLCAVLDKCPTVRALSKALKPIWVMTSIRFQFKTLQGRTPRTSSSKICAISKSTRKVRTLGLCRQPHQKSCSGKGLAPMVTTSLRWHHRLTTMLRTSIKAWHGSKLTCSRHHLCHLTQLPVISNAWISLSLARHRRTLKLMTASS